MVHVRTLLTIAEIEYASSSTVDEQILYTTAIFLQHLL
jgi:hypothetical protein